MIKHTIYVTEPKVIDTILAQKYLGAAYELTAGDVHFSGSGPHFDTLLIRSATQITDRILEQFPNLKSVIRVGTGLDAIDLAFCKSHDIAVYNAPGANADAVSDYVVGILLYALRKLNRLEVEDVRQWNRFKFTGRNMSDLSIGIVGYGAIGRLVHRKLQGFNCPAFYGFDPFVTQEQAGTGILMTSLDELLQKSDIITLHLPLLPATNHMINAEKLTLLKNDALVLNASRGGIVDESALLAILPQTSLTYIADTVEHEPQVDERLLGHERIIITPHIASLTDTSERRMLTDALDNYMKVSR